MLYADISGFSQFTAQLGRRGVPGLETLIALLNEQFDLLICIIRAHGGDVITFADD